MAGDLYAELGLEPDATDEEISAAYRAAAKIHHPDAGGDPDAFQRIQRAALVLRDPERRARYDKSGSADEPAPDLALQRALGLVREIFEAVLEQADPDRTDVIGVCKSGLRDSRQMRQSERKRTEAKIAKVGRRRDRLKIRPGVPDYLGNIIADQIEGLERQLAELEKAIAAHDQAIEILEAYEWELPGHAFARKLGAMSGE